MYVVLDNSFVCHFFRVTKYILHSFTLLVLLNKTALHGESMISGSAIITSCSGEVEVINHDGKSAKSKLHTVLLPDGLNFRTGTKSRLFMTLSNGVALGLDSETFLQCVDYTQLPFNLEEQSRRLEASVSRLYLKYKKGLLAIASNYLSPLSEIKIILPDGELRLYKGSCLIEGDATDLQITATEGTLTYYYTGNNNHEYITAPESLRILEGKKKAIVNLPINTLNPKLLSLSRATHNASRRVQFKPNKGSGLAPEPVLIVRPEYFEQPTVRPYRFRN